MGPIHGEDREDKESTQTSGRESSWKTSLCRPSMRCEDNIKTITGCVNGRWLQLAQYYVSGGLWYKFCSHSAMSINLKYCHMWIDMKSGLVIWFIGLLYLITTGNYKFHKSTHSTNHCTKAHMKSSMSSPVIAGNGSQQWRFSCSHVYVIASWLPPHN
jgi:hypothetical protein